MLWDANYLLGYHAMLMQWSHNNAIQDVKKGSLTVFMR